jgi:hypothetical protein
VRPGLQVGELSVGGGQRRGEVGGLTAGFAANGAGISSRVDPLPSLVNHRFQTALGIAEIPTDLNPQVSSPAHHQPALPLVHDRCRSREDRL